MADIRSLSKARKARARSAKEAQAAENRTRFGRSKADRQRRAALKDQGAAKLDAHKRDD